MSDTREPYRIWAATAPFRKEGTPVLGSMGKSMDRVVIMTSETFKRLVRENENMTTAKFELMDLDG